MNLVKYKFIPRESRGSTPETGSQNNATPISPPALISEKTNTIHASAKKRFEEITNKTHPFGPLNSTPNLKAKQNHPKERSFKM